VTELSLWYSKKNIAGEEFLEKPFPRTVIQGIVLVLVIVNSWLYVVELGVPTEITTLEP
jgi:hypothetical protein